MNKLRQNRQDFKIGVYPLADKAGIDASMIYRIESGEREPMLSTAVRLTDAFNKLTNRRIGVKELFYD